MLTNLESIRAIQGRVLLATGRRASAGATRIGAMLRELWSHTKLKS